VGLFAWIVLGFLAGALAEMATGRKTGGCLTRIAVGVLGALLGGTVAQAAGEEGITELSLWSVLLAFAGAVVLLLALEAVAARRK
jgi:uncharacterized membrane protein YeaQ/YmgE (transglycosylase-associated protein family)